MPEYILKKSYTNHYGLDLKSSDLTRKVEFASGMKNAQYKKNGALEKRKGYQAHASTQEGYGLFTYNRISSSGAEAPEVVLASNGLYKLLTTSLVVTYVGTDPTALLNLFYDTETSQYRCQVLEGQTIVLDLALGKGFDEASTVTCNDLKNAIDALANFTCTISGSTSTPAAFCIVVRNEDLSDSGTYTLTAKYWSAVNKTVTNPFAGSLANKNASDFENVSGVQLANTMYFSNGYDYPQKYDGQTLFRAGLPQVASLTSALGGAGAVTGTNYYHVATYIQKDNNGNLVEGADLAVTAGLNPVAQSMNVTVANVQAGSGFNTNCAIVAGAQVAVTTITVDDGAGGAHTMKQGDTAYFFDSVTGDYVERAITGVTGSSITIAGAAVTVADNAVISNNLRIAIYRNETAGTTPTVFYLVAEIPNNSFAATQVYNDNKTDAQLGFEYIPPVVPRGTPPKGKYISAWRNQLIISGNIENPYTVYFMDIDLESFPINNQFNVDTVYGDVVTGIAPSNEFFAVFKTKSIFVVSGSISDGTIRVDHLTNDLGCSAHATIKDIKGTIFFLSDKGPQYMNGSSLPKSVGDDRIEPEFGNDGLSPDEQMQLKRAVGFHDRFNEKYIVYIPCETSTGGNKHSNQFSRIYAFDYNRGAWLKWDNMDLTCGITYVGDEIYWLERQFSTYSSTVRYLMYRMHHLNDAWDYQDNVSPIDFEYDTQWEALGEPSVFKRFLTLRIFSLEDIPNNDLIFNVDTETNYISDVARASFLVELAGSGYGESQYGVAPYGDPAESVVKHRLSSGRFRSLRIRFSNNNDQQNVALTGWELQMAAPYKKEMKA